MGNLYFYSSEYSEILINLEKYLGGKTGKNESRR